MLTRPRLYQTRQRHRHQIEGSCRSDYPQRQRFRHRTQALSIVSDPSTHNLQDAKIPFEKIPDDATVCKPGTLLDLGIVGWPFCKTPFTEKRMTGLLY